MNPSSSIRISASAQRGIALVVALILLVVATLLGLSGMRGTTLQERLSANMYERSLAFQSAEAALRAAEAAIAGNAKIAVDCSPTGNLCPTLPTNTFTDSGAEWTDVAAAYRINAGLSQGTPQYYIQFMGSSTTDDELGIGRSANAAQYGAPGGTPTANFYRVTARSSDPGEAVDRAIVVLQSTIKRNL